MTLTTHLSDQAMGLLLYMGCVGILLSKRVAALQATSSLSSRFSRSFMSTRPAVQVHKSAPPQQQAGPSTMQHQKVEVVTVPESTLLELVPPWADPCPLRRSVINDAIIARAIGSTGKGLQVVFRGVENAQQSLLRQFMSEVYGMMWDVACVQEKQLVNVTVHIPREGFVSTLEEAAMTPHLDAIITDRTEEELSPTLDLIQTKRLDKGYSPVAVVSLASVAAEAYNDSFYYLEGAHSQEVPMFNCVACGGTFDVFHSGHKKLLTLAASCCKTDGVLTVGVTSDDMLSSKSLRHMIATSAERVAFVESFLEFICPQLKRRVRVITDPYGPPASEREFDAIVVSSETVAGAKKINSIREEKGLPPLAVIVVRRTDASSLSSSFLRKYQHFKLNKEIANMKAEM